MNVILRRLSILAILPLPLVCFAAAGDSPVAKRLMERVPAIGKIDEISSTPMKGLYEVRVGNDLYYTDEKGDFLISGDLIDTGTKESLTQARVAKLTAIDFASLPLADAFVTRQGTAKRRLALFVDPNCVYCKKFESELAKAQDVTIYTFLMPILGGDSPEKSRNIWCAADPAKAWRDWMLNARLPDPAPAACDSKAIARNLAYTTDKKVRGTPTLVFENGTRAPGLVSAEKLASSLDSAQAAGAALPAKAAAR